MGNMKPKRNPYSVVCDNNGCSHCGAEKTWAIIDPDDVAGGTSYGTKEEAEDIAEMLNSAFYEGRKSIKTSQK